MRGLLVYLFTKSSMWRPGSSADDATGRVCL